jgi:hypothetical protein
MGDVRERIKTAGKKNRERRTLPIGVTAIPELSRDATAVSIRSPFAAFLCVGAPESWSEWLLVCRVFRCGVTRPRVFAADGAASRSGWRPRSLEAWLLRGPKTEAPQPIFATVVSALDG